MSDNKNAAFLPLGMGVGIAIGVALGTALDNLALGLALGVAIGAGVGARQPEKEGRRWIVRRRGQRHQRAILKGF